MGQKMIFLAIDETSLVARNTSILLFADFVYGFTQMSYDMKLVNKNSCLRNVDTRSVFTGLPHTKIEKAGRLLTLPFKQPTLHDERQNFPFSDSSCRAITSTTSSSSRN